MLVQKVFCLFFSSKYSPFLRKSWCWAPLDKVFSSSRCLHHPGGCQYLNLWVLPKCILFWWPAKPHGILFDWTVPTNTSHLCIVFQFPDWEIVSVKKMILCLRGFWLLKNLNLILLFIVQYFSIEDVPKLKYIIMMGERGGGGSIRKCKISQSNKYLA